MFLMETTMFISNYHELDEACERKRKELQQVLVDRKNSFALGKEKLKGLDGSEIPKTNDVAEPTAVLNPKQFWAQKVRTAIINCAKAENSAIIVRIFDLPRELRDKIYLHLWEPHGNKEPIRDLLYWWEASDEEWMIGGVDSSKSHSLAKPTGLRPSHFVDLTFVIREFATEVLEQLQDTIGKDMRFVGDKAPVAEFLIDYEEMQAFVTDDVFGVGKTMEELVRNLDLRIDFPCDDIEQLGRSYSIEEEWSDYSEDDATLHCDDEPSSTEEDNSTLIKYANPDKETHLDELDESITFLLSIPYTERMIIHNGVSRCLDIRPRIVTLVIRYNSIDVDEGFDTILKMIGRAYNGLREKGFATKIQFDSDLGLRVLFEDDTWSWTEEDWRTNLEEKNISKVEVQNRVTAPMATIWGHLKAVLFRAAGIKP